MSEIFLDTETTGLSFRDNHRIVEIACIETKDYVPTNNVFHKLINPERDVPLEAYNVHGYNNDILGTKDVFKKIAEEFLDFIKGKKLIIHNASFDLGFLNHELNLIKKDNIKNNQVVDTLELARGKFPGSQNSLDALCRRFNIDLSKRTKHNALLDCELLREVYINLLDIKEPKLMFTNENLDLYTDKKLENYCKEIVKVSVDEVEKHKQFLKKELKKNYY
jgi:DNA polymerase III subunit epsilon